MYSGINKKYIFISYFYNNILIYVYICNVSQEYLVNVFEEKNTFIKYNQHRIVFFRKYICKYSHNAASSNYIRK